MSQMNRSDAEQNFIIFINGYRGLSLNKYTTNNKLTMEKNQNNDYSLIEFNPYLVGYWRVGGKSLDLELKNRFSNPLLLYIDGHHPLKTSNHKNVFKLSFSFLKSKLFFFLRNGRFIFNWKINQDGFLKRYQNGSMAAENFKEFVQNNSFKNIKINIVCHSMGYAYALGFIDSLKKSFDFGKMLIISPEGANYMSTDWNIFEEAWQYTCKMDWNNGNSWVIYQDGIAPQKLIKDFDKQDPSKFGRVYPPDSWPKNQRGFNKSHHLNWFGWFYNIKKSDYGYFSE